MSDHHLTIVVDNIAEKGLAAEHGFALFIQTPDHSLLLDSGQKDALQMNAPALDIDPADIDLLVLSHGHYDHTGGVAHLLSRNRNMDIYLHSGVFQPRYSLDDDRAAIVKMPLTAMEAVMRHPDDKVHWLTRPVTIDSTIGITGPIPRRFGFENTGGRFFLDAEGDTVDIIRDDVALWLQGGKGLTVCLGCCHAGLLNTLTYIIELSGAGRIDTVVGGLHLLNADRTRLEKTVSELRKFDIGRIVACHCSGESAVEYLAAHLPCPVIKGYAGMRLQSG